MILANCSCSLQCAYSPFHTPYQCPRSSATPIGLLVYIHSANATKLPQKATFLTMRNQKSTVPTTMFRIFRLMKMITSRSAMVARSGFEEILSMMVLRMRLAYEEATAKYE